MERKLASIQQIKEIKPIKNADVIELAIVNSWQCIVKKGDFKPGDLCVYFEIDSYLPIEEKYDFLKESSFKKMGDKTGYRLKTIKLRNQISQGLILSLNTFPETYEELMTSDRFKNNNELMIGLDVTSSLGIIKYETPIPAELKGSVKGDFPSYGIKTEQERIQNVFDLYQEEHKEVEFEESIKLHGASMSIIIADPSKFDCNIKKDKETNKPLDNQIHKILVRTKCKLCNGTGFNPDLLDPFHTPKMIHSTNKTLTKEEFENKKKNIGKYTIEEQKQFCLCSEGLEEPRPLGWLFKPSYVYLGVCSRNFELYFNGNNSMWKITKEHSNKIFEQYSIDKKSYMIQGEIIGPNIHGNQEKLLNADFYVFDIFDLDTYSYVSKSKRDELCKTYGFKSVPILRDKVKIFKEADTIEDILRIAEGKSLNPEVNREGLVYKSLDGKISFKVISNKWLLKHQ